MGKMNRVIGIIPKRITSTTLSLVFKTVSQIYDMYAAFYLTVFMFSLEQGLKCNCESNEQSAEKSIWLLL